MQTDLVGDTTADPKRAVYLPTIVLGGWHGIIILRATTSVTDYAAYAYSKAKSASKRKEYLT